MRTPNLGRRSSNCVVRPVSQTTSCDNACHRIQHVNEIRRQAAGYFVASGLFQLVAVIIDMLNNGSVMHKLEEIMTAAGILINIIPYAAQYLGVSSSEMSRILMLVASLNYVAGIALSIRALIRAWGDLAEGTINGLFLMIQVALGGVPEVAEKLAFTAFGELATVGLNAAAAGAAGMGQQKMSEASDQESMDINDWCSEYGSGMCS